jgi:ubiquinone biosynthesis protein
VSISAGHLSAVAGADPERRVPDRRRRRNGNLVSRLWDLVRILGRWIRIEWLLYWALLQWVWVSFVLRLRPRSADTRPQILHTFLESAGGTWIKLGQILAMRADFLPPAMVEELMKLLDKVPPFPFETARKTIEEDLGRPLAEIFAEFPTTPVAAASFGQVYHAVLSTGQEVAVKVMRPGLHTVIRADLLQLRSLASFIDTFHLLGSIRLQNQIDQLEKILHEEIDYHYEAANIRRAVDTSRYVPIMKIPNLVERLGASCVRLCTSRVLTMEFLKGIWMNDILTAIRDDDKAKLEEFRRGGLDRKVVGRRMFDIGLRQLFEVGNFHADPHAANIVVLRDNVIGYVDFGIVGTMDEELAESQSLYLQAVKDGRINDAARAMSETIVVPEKLQKRLPEFRAALSNQVRDWIVAVNNPESPLREKSIAQLLLENIRMIRSYGFELMDNTMRYYRALIIADVTVLQLDPEFDTVRALRRYFTNRQVRQLRKRSTYANLAETAAQYYELWLNGPRLSSQLSRSLRRDEESFGIVSAEYTSIWRGFARSCLLLLLAVLLLRAFGQPDIAQVIKFPFSLNFRWFAPVLLASWRVASLIGR